MNARIRIGILLLLGSLCACSSGTASTNNASNSTSGTSHSGGSGGSTGLTGGSGGTGGVNGQAGNSGSAGEQTNGGSQGTAGTGGVQGLAGSGGGGGAGVIECPGYDPPQDGSTPCRDQAECPNNYFCGPPSNVSFCGGVGPPPPCAMDTDCAMSPAGIGLVCDPLRNTGTCDRSGNCYPPCSEVACLQYQRCSIDNLHCEWVPCDDGYECYEGEVCDPTFATVDVHGCRAASCVDDGYQCPEGSLCYPEAGNLRSMIQDAHGCVQMHCSEGLTCPANTRCDDQEAGSGCVQLTCVTDADCDCGPCVQGGRCFGQWWVCSPPPPP